MRIDPPRVDSAALAGLQLGRAKHLNVESMLGLSRVQLDGLAATAATSQKLSGLLGRAGSRQLAMLSSPRFEDLISAPGRRPFETTLGTAASRQLGAQLGRAKHLNAEGLWIPDRMGGEAETARLAARIVRWASSLPGGDTRQVLVSASGAILAIATAIVAYEELGTEGAILPLLWALHQLLDLGHSLIDRIDGR